MKDTLVLDCLFVSQIVMPLNLMDVFQGHSNSATKPYQRLRRYLIKLMESAYNDSE